MSQKFRINSPSDLAILLRTSVMTIKLLYRYKQVTEHTPAATQNTWSLLNLMKDCLGSTNCTRPVCVAIWRNCDLWLSVTPCQDIQTMCMFEGEKEVVMLPSEFEQALDGSGPYGKLARTCAHKCSLSVRTHTQTSSIFFCILFQNLIQSKEVVQQTFETGSFKCTLLEG